MADFRRTKKVKTKKPFVKVEAGLPPGNHRFQLTVVDRQGNQSKPAEVVVKIRETRTPVEPITPIRPGRPSRG